LLIGDGSDGVFGAGVARLRVDPHRRFGIMNEKLAFAFVLLISKFLVFFLRFFFLTAPRGIDGIGGSALVLPVGGGLLGGAPQLPTSKLAQFADAIMPRGAVQKKKP